MLLTENVKIKINKGNIPYYKKFDEYKNVHIGDEIDVNIKYLSKQNTSVIKYVCDNCGEEKETTYKNYCDHRRDKTLDLCKGKCANKKREDTNMKLYGVKNCFQNEEMKEKSKETMMEKYGVDHNMKIEKCKNDRKQTYLKNYGVDNPSKNKIIFQKNLKNGLKIKKYKSTELYYQGTYEFDFLEKYYNTLKIENGLSIEYYDDKNNNKIYHSDFYLPYYNLIVEIKSAYWYYKHEKINILKKEYSEKRHNYILILDKNYQELDTFLKKYNQF